MKLSELMDTSKIRKKKNRVGRGIGSGSGKTCGRGTKGEGARSGSIRRHSYEGGQFRTFMKLPIRGFTRTQFQKKLDIINLKQIENIYEDGETVNLETLRTKGFISGPSYGLKILGCGELKKKVTIEAKSISQSAKEKLTKSKIDFKIV